MPSVQHAPLGILMWGKQFNFYKYFRIAMRILHEAPLRQTHNSLAMHFVSKVSQFVRLFSLKLRCFRCWTIVAEYFSFFTLMEK